MKTGTSGKRILWVDDEVDHLRSHILFLEEKGYSVETTTNGDDAIELVRNGKADLVLLDEQMPGKSGMATFIEIRSANPSIPVVMITKSEEESLMDKAIGRQVNDYIVKPVNPKQVLLVCKKLLERDEITHQRVAQDFVRQFDKIQEKRRQLLTPDDWIHIYHETVNWELKLMAAGERELLPSLNDLRKELRRDFASFIMSSYEDWLEGNIENRPILSIDIVPNYIAPLLEAGQTVLFIIVDCLRLDQWIYFHSLISPYFDTKEGYYYSILPTATPFARNAIFSGLFPQEIAERFPDYWQDLRDDERSLNIYERELLEENLARLGFKLGSGLKYEKVFTSDDAGSSAKRISGLLQQGKLISIVFNFIDMLTHGRSESEILLEMAPDEEAFRTLTLSWFRHSLLFEILKDASKKKIPVVLTTDHGSVHCLRPATVFAKKDATTNLRYKFGENIRTEEPVAYIVKDNAKIKLPALGINTNYVFACEDYYFVYPTKLREYQSRYYGSFLHGGVSPEEMILPIVTMIPK